MSAPSSPPEDALVGLNRLATIARLLSGAVHDVNNALQVISGTVELLETRPDLPPPMHDALARLRGQSSKAAGALAQVLAFTRAPRDSKGPINLRELADESLAMRDFAIRRARLSATLVADGPGPFIVSGNRGDLQQVLLNMLMNAEQALAGRGGTIVVRLSIEGGETVLRVMDEGGGVTISPPEQVFEPFVTSRAPFEAPGLGLWAARQIMRDHGGTLTLEPREAGASFAMRLPTAVLRAPSRPATTVGAGD